MAASKLGHGFLTSGTMVDWAAKRLKAHRRVIPYSQTALAPMESASSALAVESGPWARTARGSERVVRTHCTIPGPSFGVPFAR